MYANVLKQLGLTEAATETEACAAIQTLQTSAQLLGELVALTGEATPGAAKGVFVAWQGAADKLALREKQEAEEKIAAEKKEEATLLANLQTEGKITPVQVEKLWPTLNIEGKRAFAATAVKVLGKDGAKEREQKKNEDGALVTADGKRWEDLKPMERAEIFQTDNDLYVALKEDYELRTSK